MFCSTEWAQKSYFLKTIAVKKVNQNMENIRNNGKKIIPAKTGLMPTISYTS